MAGRLGVAVTDALVSRGALEIADGVGEVTAEGRRFFDSFGLPRAARPASRRVYCRTCLDWSERRDHLGGCGSVPSCLVRSEALGWVARSAAGRALTLTNAGKRGFEKSFGIELEPT